MRGDGAHDDELVLSTVAAPRAVPSLDPLFGPEPARPANATWRGLLSGIEEVAPQVREQSAGQMIDRLDRAGGEVDAFGNLDCEATGGTMPPCNLFGGRTKLADIIGRQPDWKSVV